MVSVNCVIIDDEVKLAKSLAYVLSQAQITCVDAHDGASGVRLAGAQNPDIVLLDVRLPDMSGLKVLEHIKRRSPDLPVIMMSAYGDTKDAVSAMKTGASDYLIKPFDVEELVVLIRDTLSRTDGTYNTDCPPDRSERSSELLGDSPQMLDLLVTINQVANSKGRTILLTGETGVGKTIVAREIHDRSLNKDAPFVEVNCSSLPEQLMEAELFGVVKGAFTGATSTRAGLLEIAEGGTLFLDEIGELALPLQAKLLTVLESRVYRPVGSAQEKRANVRVIAASNRNLSESVEQGEFRSDLFFRLNVIPIEIPPLRARDGDIWQLACFFAEELSEREGQRPLSLAPNVRSIFESYDWPGNVRELRNIMERLTILHPGEAIEPDMLPLDLQSGPASGAAGHAANRSDPRLRSALERNRTSSIKAVAEDAERDLVRRTLLDCDGKKGLTAERLGISRHALKRRLQKLGLQ